MNRYRIMTCSQQEYERADADPTYAPAEYQVGTLEAMSEREAESKLIRMIRDGLYEPGSQLVLMTEED